MLLDTGVDARLWESQFGFRKDRSTLDAIFVARRRIESALAQRYGRLSLLALDWSKAFDRIKHNGLMAALTRFGIPTPLIDMVAGIYRRRTFVVRDNSRESSQHQQKAGVTQGYPLSPYLFILVMTAMFSDIDKEMTSTIILKRAPNANCDEVLYAADTICISTSYANH